MKCIRTIVFLFLTKSLYVNAVHHRQGNHDIHRDNKIEIIENGNHGIPVLGRPGPQISILGDQHGGYNTQIAKMDIIQLPSNDVPTIEPPPAIVVPIGKVAAHKNQQPTQVIYPLNQAHSSNCKFGLSKDKVWSWSLGWILNSFGQIMTKYPGSLSSVVSRIISPLQTISYVSGSAEYVLQELTDKLDTYFSAVSSSCDEIRDIDGILHNVKESIGNVHSALKFFLMQIRIISTDDLEHIMVVLSKSIQILVSTISAIFQAVVHVAFQLDSNVVESILSFSCVLSSVLIYVQGCLCSALSVITSRLGANLNLHVMTSAVSRSVESISKIIPLISKNATPNLGAHISYFTFILSEIHQSLRTALHAISGVVVNVVVHLDHIVYRPVSYVVDF